jgi:hypothetical protein
MGEPFCRFFRKNRTPRFPYDVGHKIEAPASAGKKAENPKLQKTMNLPIIHPTSEVPLLRRIVREVPMANKIELACWTLGALAIDIFVRFAC